MTRKIFCSGFLITAIVLPLCLLIASLSLYEYFDSTQREQLRDALRLAAIATTHDGEDFLHEARSDRYRLTWIAADGSVLYDTEAGAAALENHADREEIRQALETGEGESVRDSATLLQKTRYIAFRLSDGTVLRIAADHASVWRLLLRLLAPTLAVALLALVLSAVLASCLARRIVAPINALDLEHPLDNDTYEELSPLLERIDRQRGEIDRRLADLRRRRDEFAQITASMNEALVLLDKNDRVLSLNPAAQRLFGAAQVAPGTDFILLDRSHELTQALALARRNGHAGLRLERSGRIWQTELSRIESGGERVGCVLLAYDITERELAEQSRREFTANVSHELKTPLQGIIGSAELIENNMVRAEDLPRFAGHIRRESKRLLALIEDILRLSELDEGCPLPRQAVDCLALAQEVCDTLQGAADAQSVTLNVGGTAVTALTVRRLVYEILQNLCENAVKYNRPGGFVRVSVQPDGENVLLRVEDNGIGIAPRDCGRVFERFYRVDKSHSKATGGTGLGLSIVKHAVACLGGTVALESALNQGTRITVTLPRKAAQPNDSNSAR